MKTIILAGGGHAHLHCLQSFYKEKPSQWNVILISPSVFQYYSGMFSGFTEGIYELEDIRVNLAQLAKAANVSFIQDAVVRIDPIRKQLTGMSGAVYQYDVVSFDIGSHVDAPLAYQDFSLNIKPNFHFPESIRYFRASPHPVVIGGGASGIELALSVLSWRKQHHLKENVTLVSSAPLLSQYGKHTSRNIEVIAARKGLDYYVNEKVEKIDEQFVMTNKGRMFPHSKVLSLTGPKAPELFKRSHLPHDPSGYLLVNDCLQSVKYRDIFGAGDCITLNSFPSLPKNGVYAVRQGPVLFANIKKFLSAEPLLSFTPQKRFLSILSTGNQEALLCYGSRSVHGKLPWKLKHAIDERFVKKYNIN